MYYRFHLRCAIITNVSGYVEEKQTDPTRYGLKDIALQSVNSELNNNTSQQDYQTIIWPQLASSSYRTCFDNLCDRRSRTSI